MSKSRLTGRIGPFFLSCPSLPWFLSTPLFSKQVIQQRGSQHTNHSQNQEFPDLLFFSPSTTHQQSPPFFADLFVLFIYWLCPASSFQLAPRPFSCSSIGQSRAWPGTRRLFLCTNLNAPLCSYRIEGVSL
ncbi:hypothetical protein J3E68DRAFT_409382 [Trichoderma sp. SZMC 28012]